MPKQQGPDLPPADEQILVDVFVARWPTGAEKVELEDGCLVFYGEWDERDIEIAQRAYPGRHVRLDQAPGEPGTLRILPTPSTTPPTSAGEAAHGDVGEGTDRGGTPGGEGADRGGTAGGEGADRGGTPGGEGAGHGGTAGGEETERAATSVPGKK